MFKNRLVALFLSAMFLFSCAGPYTPSPQIMPANIKKIAVRPFTNNTSHYGLEEKLTLAVSNELISDGRLAVVRDEKDADGILVGEINKYILQPLTYDSNLVTTQYKLWILLNVYFIDKNNNVTLWSEPNMEGLGVFFDASQPGGKTEEEAREEVWENLSKDIVKRTIDGFGSVSGVSDKKVPK